MRFQNYFPIFVDYNRISGKDNRGLRNFSGVQTMSAQYRDEARGFDGYIIHKWQEPKVVIQDALTKIST